jgi:hypothetical protein
MEGRGKRGHKGGGRWCTTMGRWPAGGRRKGGQVGPVHQWVRERGGSWATFWAELGHKEKLNRDKIKEAWLGWADREGERKIWGWVLRL